MTDNNDTGWSRRRFISTTGAGVGMLIVPGFLARNGRAYDALSGATVGGKDLPHVQPAGHFDNFGITDKIIRKVLDKAMAKGGEFADLFFQHNVTRYLGLRDGEVNQAYSQVELGCGVRVVKGDQTGFAFTEDLTETSLLAAAATAAAVAGGPSQPIAESIRRITPPSYYPIEISWENVDIEQKIPLLQKANAVAMAADKRMSKVMVYTGDTCSYIMVADSEGRRVEDFQPMGEAYINCIAEDNGRRESNGFSMGGRIGFELFTAESMEEMARTAVKRTTILLEATPPPAGEYPIVLAPGLSGILLHEAIGHGMEADFNRKGLSVYADKVGTRIAPDYVSIVDDGTNPAMRGSINIDDEAQTSQRTVLVENGILRSYMHDRISARHFKLDPTGNGRRESYQYPPVPRMRNTYMMNGPHDPRAIIASVKKGIYAENFANGQVNIGSGDFSFYLKNGYLIEDGKLTRPVKDANLIGFGPDVLEKTEMVGNDLAFYSGSGYCGKDGQRVPVGFGLPTCKCGGISVGGVS